MSVILPTSITQFPWKHSTHHPPFFYSDREAITAIALVSKCPTEGVALLLFKQIEDHFFFVTI